MSWLGPASKKKEDGKGWYFTNEWTADSLQDGAWGQAAVGGGGERMDERCAEQIEVPDKRRYKSAIGSCVMCPIYDNRVTPFPSHQLQLRTIRGSGPACPCIFISVICDIKQSYSFGFRSKSHKLFCFIRSSLFEAPVFRNGTYIIYIE